jgi:hypothetical protein
MIDTELTAPQWRINATVAICPVTCAKNKLSASLKMNEVTMFAAAGELGAGHQAFEMTFEMPEEDVRIMTFNRCLCARSMGGTRPAGHPQEELPFDVPSIVDRDGQDVQPQHEGRYPGYPSPREHRERLLQVEAQHEDKRRP